MSLLQSGHWSSAGSGHRSVLLDTFPLVALVHRANPLSLRETLSPRDLAAGTVFSPGGREAVEWIARRTGCPLRIAEPTMKICPVDSSELLFDENTFVVKPEQHARRTTSPERASIVPLVNDDGSPIEVALNLVWRCDLRIGGPERALIDYIVEAYATR